MTRRAEAIERYRRKVRDLGYNADEVTLLIIGFAAGWDELETGLARIAAAIRDLTQDPS